MPYDRLANALSLSLGRAEALQLLQCLEATVPFKGHVRVGAVLFRRGDVVVQTGQCPGLEESILGLRAGDPIRKMLRDDGVAVAVDTQAVVPSLGRQNFVDVVRSLLDKSALGPDRVEVDGDGGCFGLAC